MPSLRSVKKAPRADVWVTEIRVKRSKETAALRRLIALVRKYEDLSGAD
jgi:hypothetical protein